jgi:hypothetical protein
MIHSKGFRKFPGSVLEIEESAGFACRFNYITVKSSLMFSSRQSSGCRSSRGQRPWRVSVSVSAALSFLFKKLRFLKNSYPIYLGISENTTIQSKGFRKFPGSVLEIEESAGFACRFNYITVKSSLMFSSRQSSGCRNSRG